MNIGDRIKYYREKKNYSVNKLANLCGISQSYLRDVELNHKNPTVEMLGIICDTLEISLKDFFDEDNATNLLNDPLIASIYKLNNEQRLALQKFIDTIT